MKMFKRLKDFLVGVFGCDESYDFPDFECQNYMVMYGCYSENEEKKMIYNLDGKNFTEEDLPTEEEFEEMVTEENEETAEEVIPS